MREGGYVETDSPGNSLIPGCFSEVGSSDALEDFDNDANTRCGRDEHFLRIRNLTEVAKI